MYEEAETLLAKLLADVLGTLMQDTSSFDICKSRERDATIYMVRIDAERMAAALGEGGRTLRSLETLIQGMGSKLGRDFRIQVVRRRPV